MTAQESKILRIQLYHPFMGIHNFDINSRDSFSDLRALLALHTPMTIFDNYRLEANGKLLPQFQQIGQVINNETRINLVIQPYDQRSSYYHLERVKEILANPIQWAMLNSRQTCEQKQYTNQKLPQNVTIDNFLQLQISSPLYKSQSESEKHLTFLQQLNFSIHNPPPMHRKLTGDFFYLQIKTLEGHEEHVTACPLGFYVNNSSNSCFNTNNNAGIHFYNLFDLLKHLSPKFKQNFNNIKKIYKISELDKAIFSAFRAPAMCEWLKNSPQFFQKKSKNNQWRYYNFDDPNDNTTIKDWNEIVQINSILQSDSQADILNKQKSQFKLYQDFITFAKEAAVKALDSQINSSKFQTSLMKRTFVYGSVYVWFAEDNPLSYETHQNQKITRRAINAQIRNLQMLENSKTFNINFKHTVLINYKGYDIVVQTIIPGNSLQSKNKQKIKKDFHRQIKDDKIIEQISRVLKLQSKNLYRDQNNQVQSALVHPQILGLKSDDKRCYILNLYSLSARDLNFPGAVNNSTHLRKQLIQIYNQKQLCSKNINTMIDSGYNLIFNQRIRQQHMKLNSLKTYAEQIMVPLCIQSFLKQNKKYLADSKSVIKVMHQFGLSSRYLGSIYKKSVQFQAAHIKIIIQRVALVKILKNIFRQALRKCQLGDIKSTLSRLLNCIFCSQILQYSMDQTLAKDDLKDQISTNASRKKKKKIDLGYQNMQDHINIKISSQGSGQIKPSELWEHIKQVALFRYNIKWNESKIHMLKCIQNQFGKCAVLRDLCINIGIILQKIQYFQKHGLIFKPEHIQQFRPVTKCISLKNKYIESLIKQGDILIQRKRVQQAIDIYNQAINYATSNFGIVTQQLALLNKKVGQIYFRIGQIDAALLFVHCAQKMCEKIYGESHVETLECYNLLSQFNFFYRNFQAAEYYLIKAIHTSTLSFGEQYPELIIGYLNLSTLYQVSSRFMDSITCISHALRIVLRVFGQNSINTAICYAAMSTAHFQIPDIESSIFFQQKSIQILKNILRADDPRLKQAVKVLEFYYHLQNTKKVKENYDKQRKKLMSNPQLYAGYPLFRLPQYGQYNAKDRQFICRKMQNFMQYPGKFYA